MTEPRRFSTSRLPSGRARRLAVAASGLAVLLVAMPFAAAQGSDPTDPPAILGIDPATGPPGTSVVVTGENFAEDGDVYLGGYLVASTMMDAQTLTFTVPEMAAMEANLQVYNAHGGASICCFAVTDPEAEPEPTPDATTAPGGDGGTTSCNEREKNVQCNALGIIAMDSQRDIRGERIDLTAEITLNTAFADRDARWVLFSVRNVTDGESSPVTLSVNRFETAHGPIVTTDVKTRSNEVNMWVHVIDVPIGTPITIDMNVGASERGAYRLETLVMVFDRGYSPIKDAQGQDASLFSFTLLGVNKETAGGGSSGKLSGLNKVPGFETALAVAALAAVAVAVARRRST